MANAREAEEDAVTVREDLHRLIDELPDQELAAARTYLKALRATSDPLATLLAVAPVDDEPVTEEEEAGAAKAREQYRRGETLTADNVKRPLAS